MTGVQTCALPISAFLEELSGTGESKEGPTWGTILEKLLATDDKEPKREFADILLTFIKSSDDGLFVFFFRSSSSNKHSHPNPQKN